MNPEEVRKSKMTNSRQGVRHALLAAAVLLLAAVPAWPQKVLANVQWSAINSPTASPDNKHIAYLIKNSLYIDGEKIQAWDGICEDKLQWSADGSTVGFWGIREDRQWRLVLYRLASKNITEFKSFGIFERRHGAEREILMVPGATIGLSDIVRSDFAISPNGSLVAFAYWDGNFANRSGKGGKPSAWRVLNSGDSEPTVTFWDEVLRGEELKFSPDGTKLTYVGVQSRLFTVVIGTESSSGWRDTGWVFFSEDSKHSAYTGRQENMHYLVVDGRKQEIPSVEELGYYAAISNDGRLTLWNAKAGGRWWLYSRKTSPPRSPVRTASKKQAATKSGPVGTVPPASELLSKVGDRSFDGIYNISLHESGRFAWVGRDQGQWYVMDGPSSSPAYRERPGKPVFSPNGKHLAYRVKTMQGRSAVVRDGVVSADHWLVLSDPVFAGNDQVRYLAVERADGPVLFVETKVSP
jgi:hypothetical protein